MVARKSLGPTRAKRGSIIRRSKSDWRSAEGGFLKARRLHLRPDAKSGAYHCPVSSCEHGKSFLSVRGCRKHVTSLHGWYFFFRYKPRGNGIVPYESTSSLLDTAGAKRASTATMPSLASTCSFSQSFVAWLMSDSGGSKSATQAEQISCRIRKYLRYCFPDEDADYEIPGSAVDSSLTCVNKLLCFIDELREKWGLGYSGQAGFVNAFFDVLDYRKTMGAFLSSNMNILSVVEVFLPRPRRSLSRKMRLNWNKLLDVEHLESQGCWASIDDLKSVLPYHQPRFNQIIQRSRNRDAETISAHEISFCTHFVCTMLFLSIKASRPMTYRHLTVRMIESIEGESGSIDSTRFKTCHKYGFNTLLFNAEHLSILRAYIRHIRPLLPSSSPYLLVTRHGKQMSKLSSILGNFVHQATQRYISPTRLRQIVETEAGYRLTTEQQAFVTEDQKHTSQVARIHYKKMRSRRVAAKAREALQELGLPVSVDSVDSLPVPHSSQIDPAADTLQDSKAFIQIKREEPFPFPPPLLVKTGTNTYNRFSEEEDVCLFNGIMRHGWGRWARILRDPDYSFLPHRTSRTLGQRAVLKKMKFR